MSSHHAYDYQAYLTSSCIRVTQGGITSSQVRSTVECPGKIEKSQAVHNIKSKLVWTSPLFWKRVTICTFHNVSQLTPVLNLGNVQDRLGATSTHIHFQCHAASTSSTTRVVTVGIASRRGEGRGRERGKGEGGRRKEVSYCRTWHNGQCMRYTMLLYAALEFLQSQTPLVLLYLPYRLYQGQHGNRWEAWLPSHVRSCTRHGVQFSHPVS